MTPMTFSSCAAVASFLYQREQQISSNRFEENIMHAYARMFLEEFMNLWPTIETQSEAEQALAVRSFLLRNQKFILEHFKSYAAFPLDLIRPLLFALTRCVVVVMNDTDDVFGCLDILIPPGSISFDGEFAYLYDIFSNETYERSEFPKSLQFKFKLTSKLIELLQVKYEFSSFMDLRIFSTLPTDEIYQILLEQPAVHQQILNELGNINVFSHFCKKFSADKLKGYLPLLPSLIATIVRSHTDIIVLLNELDDEKTALIIQAASKKFSKLITDWQTLNAVSFHLRPAQNLALMTSLSEVLLSCRYDDLSFRSLLRYGNDREHTQLLELVAPHLPQHLLSQQQLRTFLRLVRSCNRLFILRSVREKLPGLITKLSELTELLHELDTPGQYKLLEALDGHLSKIINNKIQLERLLDALSIQQPAITLQALGEELPSLIDKVFLEELKTLYLPTQSYDQHLCFIDLSGILKLLSPEQCDQVLRELHCLPLLFPHVIDVTETLKELSLENGKQFMKHIRLLDEEGKLKHLNKEYRETEELANAMRHFSMEQSKLFIEALNLKPIIMSSNHSLSEFLSQLTSERGLEILKILGNDSLKYYKGGDKFFKHLKTLSIVESNDVFEALVDAIDALLKGTYQHDNAFPSLSNQERALAYHVLLEMLPRFIRNQSQLVHTFQSLPASLCGELRLKMKSLKVYENNSQRLIDVLKDEPEKISILQQKEQSNFLSSLNPFNFFSGGEQKKDVVADIREPLLPKY
ncbi:MAG: hypothetical protein H2069_01025 [Legionella sp.]|nr:hypothetical protein [Legionella sp.]